MPFIAASSLPAFCTAHAEAHLLLGKDVSFANNVFVKCDNTSMQLSLYHITRSVSNTALRHPHRLPLWLIVFASLNQISSRHSATADNMASLHSSITESDYVAKLYGYKAMW